MGAASVLQAGMRVPGGIYATEKMLGAYRWRCNCLEQVANVAFLPGIQKYSLAMPDIPDWGYGFPIGGCCATDPNQGGVIFSGRRRATTSTAAFV